MRRIFAFLVSTLDGYDEGPNGEFDWPNVDEEFNRFALEQIEEVNTLLFGRRTYEVMAAYWPTPEARDDDPAIAEVMNEIPKIVVSGSLERADWANSRLIRSVDEVAGIKEEPGKDIAVFGSSALTVSLLERGLLDEVRVMVNPIILGDGRSLFRTAEERVPLTLVGTRRFGSGNVLLRYELAR
jgi:dihydrofolate reductase